MDLSRTPFAEVLWSSSAGRRSGDLIVDADDLPRRTVYFDQGRLVAASSEDPRQRLGSYLLSQGRVGVDELARAEALIHSARQRRIGEALVAAGVLRRDEVGRTVARLAREITLSLFPLTRGSAQFVEGEPSIPVEAMVGVSLHRLLYVGVRSMRSPELIRAGLGELGRRVRLAPAPPFRFILRKCPPGELRILEQVREPVPIAELVTERGKPSAARIKAVYALCASGVIEDATAPGEAPALRPVAHIESNTFLLAEVDAPASEPQGAPPRLEVEQELAFSGRLDTDTWIRVSSREDVIRALEAKRRRYLGFLDRVGGDPALQRDVETLIGRITVFLLRLTGEGGGPPLGGAATQTVPPLVRTHVDPPGDPGPRKIPLGRKPVRVGGDSGSHARRAGDETGPTRARREDSGPTPRVRERDSGPRPPARSGDSGPVPRVRERDSGPVPRAPASGTGPVPAERPEPISQLVRNGELRMNLNDFASATQIYKRLVERAPDVAGYRLRLALAMARWPPTTREAEREFLEAIRRDPNNPRIHYQFGLYYKNLKLKSRAIEEMRTAVALDPQNEGAREHLKDLSPNDPLLDDLSWGD
jgi:hypothetical protein